MIHHIISPEGGNSKSLHDSAPPQDHAPGGLKSNSEETLLNLQKIMSDDIRGSLLSMLATLKLLNRGYYGNMDVAAANQTKGLLSSATRLIGMVDACLGRAFAVRNDVEIAAPKKTVIE
jgi:hypothetical protein